MKPSLSAILLSVTFVTFAPHTAVAAPITEGTVFLDPDIITASDPSTFVGLTFAGTGSVLMFDRRIAAFSFFNAFLFDVTFSDGLGTQIQVNPEFGSAANAQIEAAKYGLLIGQLPTALRVDVDTVWIHKGLQPFGGGNNNILIHTDQADDYAAGGFLEEVFVHEGSHTSLDATHAGSPGWLAAQAADANFISTYAMDNPTREDIAESFLPWLALRHRADRIDASLELAIAQAIPNRLEYFDSQSFDLFPVVASAPIPEPTTLVLFSTGLAGVLGWGRMKIKRGPRV